MAKYDIKNLQELDMLILQKSLDAEKLQKTLKKRAEKALDFYSPQRVATYVGANILDKIDWAQVAKSAVQLVLLKNLKK